MIDLDEIDARNLPDEGDPLVWLYEHRKKISEQYPTVDTLFEYYNTRPSTVEEALAYVNAKIAAQQGQHEERLAQVTD
ncbi:MAG: hypothetical protein ACRC10_00330 [Thermoguttaceae bacterium]